jgi:hypothetical protein
LTETEYLQLQTSSDEPCSENSRNAARSFSDIVRNTQDGRTQLFRETKEPLFVELVRQLKKRGTKVCRAFPNFQFLKTKLGVVHVGVSLAGGWMDCGPSSLCAASS